MRTCLTLTALLFLAGCGKPEFTHRAEYDALEPYAQEYVDQVLTTYFGTPTDMVVWDKLPLEKHLGKGTVRSASDRTLAIDLSEPHAEITPGTELLWVADDLGSSHSAWVESWNEETHTARLRDKLTELPPVGAALIIGPGQRLARGRHLYAVHCQHCHGVSGDGDGPTARYLNPLPRDYRKGIFKFTTTQAPQRASREDLARTILNGIPGTYMPSFKLLTKDELNDLVEYVLWLSMRGETEYMLVRYLSDSYSQEAVAERLQAAGAKRSAGDSDVETAASIRQEFLDGVNDPDETPAELMSFIDLIVSRWAEAQTPEALVTPQEEHLPYEEESIARGRKLFLSADLNCVACHGEAGFGDGPQTYSVTTNSETNQPNPLPGLYDAWGNRIDPRNLHSGVYRGGRRPIDLYCRIHAGIKGTPMPAFGAKLKDQQIWDLVNYIYSVPFERVEAGNGDPPAPAPAPQEVATNSSKVTP